MSKAHPDWLEHLLVDASPDVIAASFPWAQSMRDCPQDSVFHAEGDVWTHTLMVKAALDANTAHRSDSKAKTALRLGAWFHDCAKPLTTVIEFDEEENRERVRQPGHAPLGAAIAWQSLIDAGCDADLARTVHGLVFWHQRPSHVLSEKNHLARILRYGTEAAGCTWDDLLTFCLSDNEGRICKTDNPQNAIDEIKLLGMAIDEESETLGCDLRHGGTVFETDSARLAYFRRAKRSLYFTPQEPVGSRVIIASGIPGSGKSTFMADRFPGMAQVCMDDIRAALKIGPDDNQGQVIQEAFSQARVLLRRKEPFIWNATCLTRMSRQKVISLVLSYDAHVTGYQMDVPLGTVRSRNAQREARIPDAIIDKMARGREPIASDEVHQLFSVDAQSVVSQVRFQDRERPELQISHDEDAPAP